MTLEFSKLIKVKICEKQRGLNGVAAWDPHHASRAVAAAAGHYVKCFDTRDKKETWSIGEGSNVKSIDFNPNKQNQLSIGGEDGEVRFYDVRLVRLTFITVQTLFLAFRNTKKSILKLSNLHTHWVWNVKYNPVHDQLFLSSGGDGRVYLHSVTSIRYGLIWYDMFFIKIYSARNLSDLLLKTKLNQKLKMELF